MDFRPQQYPYRAFISYRHHNAQVAKSIYRSLISYRLPLALLNSQGIFGKHQSDRVQVFLDEECLEVGDTLGNKLIEKLDQSAFLIVLCSQSARQSKYVKLEIEHFLQKNPPNRIFPVYLLEDDKHKIEDILPEPLSNLGDKCPLGIEWKAGGETTVRNKLLASLLGFRQEEISREQEITDKRANNRRRIAFGTIMALSVISAITSYWGQIKSNQAAESAILASETLIETTPRMKLLLDQGKLTVSDLQPLLYTLKNLFSSKENEFKSSTRIQFFAGVALMRAGELHRSAGEHDTWIQQAEKSWEMLNGIKDELNSARIVTLCESLITLKDAYIHQFEFDKAIETMRACDKLMRARLEEGPDGSTLVKLVNQRVSAAIYSSDIWKEQGRFKEAQAELDTAKSFETSLKGLPPEDLRLATLRLKGCLDIAKASVSLSAWQHQDALQRLQEAAEYFEHGEYSKNLPRELSETELCVGDMKHLKEFRAQIWEALLDRTPDALRYMDAQIAGLEDSAKRDRFNRGILASLASYYVRRGNIHFSARVNEINCNDAASCRQDKLKDVIADFVKAATLMEELRQFDPENSNWRFQLANTYSQQGNLYFRLFEQGQTFPDECGGDCLARAVELAKSALEHLNHIAHRHQRSNGGANVWPELLIARVTVMAQLSRYTREGGDLEGARTQLAEAEALMRTHWPEAAETKTNAQALAADVVFTQAILSDERADQLCEAKETEAGVALFRSNIRIFEKSVEREPLWHRMWRELLWAHYKITECVKKSGSPEAIQTAYREACSQLLALPQGYSELRLAHRDAEKIKSSAAKAGFPCTQ